MSLFLTAVKVLQCMLLSLFSCITILSYCEYLYWLQLPTSTNKAVVNILISQYETVSGMLISEQAF